MLSVEQCRAARALLNWSAETLAERGGVGVATVRRFETGASVASDSHQAIELALTSAGIELIDSGGRSLSGGEGVRFVDPRRTQP